MPRSKQGQGRYDVPKQDGVLYCSQQPISAIAELIQPFRGQTIGPAHLERPDHMIMALAHFRLAEPSRLPNLDDPKALVTLKIRPSQVLTHNRSTTRIIAERLFQNGSDGFLWPSALEASWINACLFASRVQSRLSLAGPIQPITLDLAEVVEAAKVIGVYLK